MVLAALAFERCATLMVCWLRWTGLTRARVVWLGWCTAWSLAIVRSLGLLPPTICRPLDLTLAAWLDQCLSALPTGGLLVRDGGGGGGGSGGGCEAGPVPFGTSQRGASYSRLEAVAVAAAVAVVVGWWRSW